MPILTRDQVRSLDEIAIQRFGIPGMVLMENAGAGAARVLVDRLAPELSDLILVVAGRGNNGGDGFVIARHLTNRGYDVEIAILGEVDAFRGTGDSGVNFGIVERMGIRITPCAALSALLPSISRAGKVVDAILGTGLTGSPRGLYADAIRAINDAAHSVLAVDLPSGLDCDSGQPLGETIRAQCTATFAAMKVGLTQPVAANWTGPVEVVDIGAPLVWS